MNVKVKGYLLGAVAAATYGMNPLFTLPLYKEGMTPDAVLFFRYLFAVPVLGLMLKARGRNFRINRRQAMVLAALGVLFALSSLTLFQSYRYMDAGIASTILFVYPIIVAVIMTVVYKEKFSLQTTVCILTAFVGISLLYSGGDGPTLSLTGTLLVLGSALSYAIYIVGINQKSLKDVATLKVTFYALLFGWLVFAVSIVADGNLPLPPADKWYMWGNLLALALLPTAVSLLCTTAAIQCIGSTPTAILGALEPATAVFIGITVFGEHLTPRDALGLLLIVGAVSIVVAGGSITHHLVRFRKLFPRLRHHKYGAGRK